MKRQAQKQTKSAKAKAPKKTKTPNPWVAVGNAAKDARLAARKVREITKAPTIDVSKLKAALGAAHAALDVVGKLAAEVAKGGAR